MPRRKAVQTQKPWGNKSPAKEKEEKNSVICPRCGDQVYINQWRNEYECFVCGMDLSEIVKTKGA